jgi:hypothetical protein
LGASNVKIGALPDGSDSGALEVAEGDALYFGVACLFATRACFRRARGEAPF